MVENSSFEPLDYRVLSEAEMVARAKGFYRDIEKRRPVRDFSIKRVPQAVIKHAIKSAGTAPSVANKQPWHFVAVSNSTLKRQIRNEVEKNQYALNQIELDQEAYTQGKAALKNTEKPFFESASHLIVIFQKSVGTGESEEHQFRDMIGESMGVAVGFLIDALYHSGVATLVHSPTPETRLNELLGRPVEETPYLIVVAGYPEANCVVPALMKKALPEIATFLD